MLQEEEKWLPHLIGVIPRMGYPNRLSAFLVALEGWRRGLDLEFFREDGQKLLIKYKLSSENKQVIFRSSTGDYVPQEAIKICENKELTKKYLLRNNVPVPEGKMFDDNDDETDILKYAEKIGFPVVLKPVDGSGGKGVFANLKDRDSLKEALHHLRNVLGYSRYILERYIVGDEYRIVVLNGEVIGAINRVPANVVGDGVSTIRELVKKKNDERKKNPHLQGRMITINQEVINHLYANHYSLETIPKKGEVVTLRLNSNISTGGDSIDVTDKLYPDVKKAAIDATNSIPGLVMSGIDMIVNHETKKGVVIEVNTRPGLGGHIFPIEGKPRDLPKKIIDYYFPETVENERSLFYFDLNPILEPLRDRSAERVKVSRLPVGYHYSKKYIIKGDFDIRKYRSWIKKRALELGMHGYTDQLDENTVEAVLVSTDESFLQQLKDEFSNGPSNTNVKIDSIEEYVWNLPVKIGFETKDNKISIREAREIEKNNKKLQREYERLVKKYSEIQNSRSWKITSPIRWIFGKIKSLLR